MAHETRKGETQGPKMPEWWARRYSGEAAHRSAVNDLIKAFPQFDAAEIGALYDLKKRDMEGNQTDQVKITFLNSTLVSAEVRRVLWAVQRERTQGGSGTAGK